MEQAHRVERLSQDFGPTPFISLRSSAPPSRAADSRAGFVPAGTALSDCFSSDLFLVTGAAALGFALGLAAFAGAFFAALGAGFSLALLASADAFALPQGASQRHLGPVDAFDRVANIRRELNGGIVLCVPAVKLLEAGQPVQRFRCIAPILRTRHRDIATPPGRR